MNLVPNKQISSRTRSTEQVKNLLTLSGLEPLSCEDWGWLFNFSDDGFLTKLAMCLADWCFLELVSRPSFWEHAGGLGVQQVSVLLFSLQPVGSFWIELEHLAKRWGQQEKMQERRQKGWMLFMKFLACLLILWKFWNWHIKHYFKVYIREPSAPRTFVSMAEMMKKFQSSTRDLSLPYIKSSLSHVITRSLFLTF